MADLGRPAASPGRQRMLRRRRRSMVLLALLVTAVLGLVDLATPDAAEQRAAPAPTPTTVPARPVPTPSPRATPAPAPARTVIPGGTGAMAYADDAGPVLGRGGELRRFHVTVEDGLGQDPAGFAGTVDRILGDPRGWAASGRLRFQRVPRAAPAEFTVVLASAATSERICATGGLRTEGYTSCRLPGRVVINLDRWTGAIPGYGAPLATYQAYAVNHEVGHQLGLGHEACPGPGRPAPVMQQQTYGLRGCVANPWPYLDGARYAGPAVN